MQEKSRKNDAFIQGIGTAVPTQRLYQNDAARIARQTCAYSSREGKWSDRMYESVRVRERGCAAMNGNSSTTTSFDRFPVATDELDRGPSTGQRMGWYANAAARLAVQSAGDALENAGVGATAVTHLVTASCTGFEAPGVDVGLIDALGLDADVARTNIGFMGCHAALNALRVARAFVEADPQACVLVCAVELCSLHFSYAHEPDRMLGNALFADGSASAVIGSRPGRAGLRVCASGSHLVPDSIGAIGWRVGDHGFEMSLSPQMPQMIAERVRPWMEDWLGRNGRSVDAIGSWAVHPGGPKVLEAVVDGLGLEPSAMDDSFSVLEANGNMSSPTVLFILDRLKAKEAPRPWVGIGFGPGLAMEAVLIDEP